MKLISRVILLLMLLAAVAMLVLGPRGQPQLPADDYTVVTYWEKWPGPEGRQMQQIVDWFNQTVGQEKKIFVKYLAISQLDRKALIATAAGVPPDIAGLWDRHVVTFAARDAVEPLDDLAAEYGIDAGDYKPVFWDMCTYRGRLWALMTTPAIVALHYNRLAYYDSAEAIRAAGLDPFSAPRTIAELDVYARAIDRRDSAGRITRAGHIPMEPNWYVTVLSFWFGGRLWDPEAGRFYLTDDPVVRAYEWMQSYPRRLGRAALSEFSDQFGNFGSPTSPFMTGQVAMVLQGPWMANYTYNLRPSMSEVLVPKSVEPLLPRVARPFNYEWAVEAFPPEDPERVDPTFAQLDVLMIPRGARNKRQAFEFMAFVQRQEVMERLCSMHCKLSPLNRVSDDFVRRHPNPYIGVFERLSRSPNARTAEKSPMQQEVGDELTFGIQRLYLNSDPSSPNYVRPRDALRDVQNRLEVKYQQFVERQRRRGNAYPPLSAEVSR